MFFPRNTLASEKGGEFAALVSDYGRAKGSNWRTGPLLGAPGAAGRPRSGANSWRTADFGLTERRRGLRLRDRTLAKWPVWMVAMAGTLADPAAVTLFVYLNTSRPLPETLAQLNLTQQVPRFRSFPLTFKEKWRASPVSISQLQDGPQKGFVRCNSSNGILDSMLF